MVLRKLSQTLMVSLAFMVATFSSGLLQPAVAYAADKPKDTVPGNNGTLKIHEKGSTVEDPSNEPKVCVFNFEGFGFDAGQIGLIVIEPQGNDSETTDTASVSFGPANANGEYATTYLNDGGETLDNGHYKSTLYGKDANGAYTIDLKAKSKVFKVECAPVVVPPAGSLTVDVTCEAGSFSGTVTAPIDGVATYKVNGNLTTPGAYTNLIGTYTVEMFVNGTLVDTEIVIVPACEDEVLYANPTAPIVTDICGIADDGVILPQNTDQITYSLNGNVVTATLVNPLTHDFGTSLNGYVVAGNGLTATFTANFPNDEPCLTPSVCETPANGGVITQNTPGWELYGNAELVNNGIALSSTAWSGSYVENTNDYSISDALQLSWTYEGTVSGAHGIAIIFETADGDYIHYEPEPYSDDFWTNSAGILPANGGGQGGTYSGSLQDILDTAGDLTIVNTYFYFTSATANDIVLKSLSFNCATYTFDKEEVVEDENDGLCHATGSESNPYVFIGNISSAGIYNGHYGVGNGDHQNAEDIIPPFTYQGQTYSQNWDTAGQAIYRADCKVNDEEPSPAADIDFAVVCVTNGVKVTLTNSGNASGTATVNGTIHTVAANSSKEVVLDYDLGTPFMTEVTVTIGQTTSTQTVNCTPGGGGGTPVIPVTPTTPGQTLGTTAPTPVAAAVLPAILPATGGVDSPFMVIVASILAYGAAYFLQGRRLIARKETIQA